MASQVRRRPNTFNLTHQMRLMRQLGQTTCLQVPIVCVHLVAFETQDPYAQEWNNTQGVMAAMQVGRLEASAALNLLQNIPEEIVERLTTMVKCLAKSFLLFAFENEERNCVLELQVLHDDQVYQSRLFGAWMV